MFTTLFSLSLFIALIRSVFAQSILSIDTPDFIQCQPTQITWTSTGNIPYDLLVVSAEDVCGEALEDLGNLTSTDTTWNVAIAAGTQVVLSLFDSVGNEAWSGTITVGSSNDTSCLTSTSSSVAPPTSSVAPPISTPAVTGTPLTTLPSGGTTTHAATSSSPKSSASGIATAGLSPISGALSTRPLGVVTLFSSAVLTVVAFAL